MKSKICSLFKGFVGTSIVMLLAISVSCNDKEKENDAQETDVADAMDIREDNSTVNEYVTFISNDKNKMTLDHAYTNEALLKLTAAIDAMAGEVDFNIKADLDKARESANKIKENPFDTSHADEIKKAAEILSTSLQNIQAARFPELSDEAEQVKSAAMAIDPNVLTLDQKEAVKTFLTRSSDLLNRMN